MKKNSNISPPRLAQKFLLTFLRDDLAEEVMGDLDERFHQSLKRNSAFRSKVKYWYEVMNYVRPFAMRKASTLSINHVDMFRNYFTIGWRSLLKQRMYSLVKIGGFAFGIAACLLISLYIKDELSYDKHYPAGDRIYRVYEIFNDDQIYKSVWFQAPLAKALEEDFPEIEKAGRYNSSELFGAGGVQIRRADKTENTYEEGYVFMDQELLDIFSIPVVAGNPKHLLDEPNTIVLTKRKADKYFPGEDPVGKLIIVNDDQKNPLKVAGVIEDFPSNSHLNFDFIRTLKGVEFWPGEQDFWGATNYPTYVLLREGADVEALNEKLQSVVKKYLLPLWIEWGRADAEKLVTQTSFALQPVKDIHLYSADFYDTVVNGDIKFVYLFGAVAGFILIIACINFVNLSTAKSANRAKEVGLRKTVGSYRSNIISQFIAESLLYSFISFAIGVALAWVLLPYFNMLAGKSIVFPIEEWWLFPLLIVSSIAVGILAGIYPAFYLSSFKPAQVLKGNVSRGSKNARLRGALVVFQFTASIVLIIGTIIIYNQVQYLLNKKVGFDKDQIVMLHGTGTLGDQVRTFRDELKQLSVVKSASISDYLPVKGTKRNGNGFNLEGKEKEQKSVSGQMREVDENYLSTLGIKIIEGRNFNRELASDTVSVIINQRMAKELGLKPPYVGQRIQNWKPWTIIGVVEDFHFETMREKITPLCFSLGISPGIVSVKLQGSDMTFNMKEIEKLWKKFAPHQPIRYSFLDENFARMYDDVKRMGQIFTSFACLRSS